MEAMAPHVKCISQTLANSGSLPSGLFRAQTPLFGVFFQNYITVNMYAFLVVFHSAELKFKCFNT